MKNPKLIILSAPSGAGKTTMCKRLLKDFASQMVLSISTTTRPPRGNEVHGKEYFFTTEAEFKEQIAKGWFAEWAQVHGYYYGTSKKVVEDTLASGKCVVLDIDVQGSESLSKSLPGKCLTFFIAPPSLEILEKRLRARGTDSLSHLETRIQNARLEMQRADESDYIIVNDDLEQAYSKLVETIEKDLGIKRG